MLDSSVRWVASFAVSAWIAFLPCASAAPVLPQSAIRADIEIAGQALGTVLPRLEQQFHVRLIAGRELAGQRVTLYLKNASVELLARGLQELLTPAPDAGVFWRRRREGSWVLEESVNRRRLVARLRNQDLDLFRQHLESELEWLRGQAPQQVDAAGRGPSPRLRAMQARQAVASLLEMLGEVGRERLLAGVPFVTQIGQLPPSLRDAFRAYVAPRAARLAGRPVEEADPYWYALILARAPRDPSGAELVESLITPDGFQWARRTLLGADEREPPTILWPPFSLPSVSDAERSEAARRVSLTLAPLPDAPPGAIVRQDLDQVLGTVARECQLNVIADGYLRGRQPFRANLNVTDYPFEKLLSYVCYRWGCTWRFLDRERTTVLVRAKGWVQEDLADVPQPVVEELRQRLRADRSPSLPDLLRLAELSTAQVHKLMDVGICPGASGIIVPGFHDDAGVKPCLQFFNRLPSALQRRAQSAEGLPLRAVPRDLVTKWLLTTLIVEAGAVTPEMQRDLVFSLRPGSRDPAAPEGFEISICSPRQPGTQWTRHIQPPPRPTGAPPGPSVAG